MSGSVKVNDPITPFWTWFFFGTGGRPGFKRLLDKWIFFHLIIGFALSKIQISTGEVSKDALIPMISVFIGLTFSWAGNANSLLQSEKIIRMSEKRRGGIYEYVYTFQLCVFIMLFAIGAWTVAAIQVPYPTWMGFINYDDFDFFVRVFLLGLLSLTLRTCWQTVVGANFLLLSQILLPNNELLEHQLKLPSITANPDASENGSKSQKQKTEP